MKKSPKKPARVVPDACPCDSGKRYPDCCGPLHSGVQEAPDAAALVRARFSAYCVGESDYLWQTLHTEHDDRASGAKGQADLRAVVEGLGARRLRRLRRLRILDQRAPDAHGVALVLFAGEVMQQGKSHGFVELASFVEENGAWRSIAAINRLSQELSHDLDHLVIDHWDCTHHH